MIRIAQFFIFTSDLPAVFFDLRNWLSIGLKQWKSSNKP
jgi:hypothetical protein